MKEILDLVAPRLGQWRRQSADNVSFSCPFHQQGSRRTFTLSLSLSKGLYFCFSCGAKGHFARLIDELGLPVDGYVETLLEALKKSRAERKHEGVEEVSFWSEGLPEASLGFFDYCPESLRKEGFTVETLQYFEVGYDPRHQRITYPLRNVLGGLEGVSGRATLPSQSPRYKVYGKEWVEWGVKPPRTQPPPVLWNAHRVLPELRGHRRPQVILVEGYKACMWLHQHGYPRVMALGGSKMSYPLRCLLEAVGVEVLLLLDQDQAGRAGTRAITEELLGSTPCRVGTYRDGAQPSDLGKTELDTALSTAEEACAWLLSQGE